jgi:hypothetical protein
MTPHNSLKRSESNAAPQPHPNLRIPASHSTEIPPATCTVAQLLALETLPPVIDVTVVDLARYLSSEPASIEGIDISKLPLPPPAFTRSIKSAFHNTLLSGRRSVIHPHDSALRLPFWIVSYWDEMGRVVKARAEWNSAYLWLRRLEACVHPMVSLVTDALHSFTKLGWDIPLEGPAKILRTSELASFLSTNWVDGHLLDRILARIADRISTTPSLGDKVYLEDLTFSLTLRKDDASWKSYAFDNSFRHLRMVGNRIADGTIVLEIIPINIKGIHWAVLFVSASAGEIKYGDSLSWDWPSHDIKRLQQWLRLHELPTFAEAGNLPSGLQEDSYSCSVAMANIIEHSLFDEPLFTDANKHHLRIREYLLLIQPTLEVSHFSLFSDFQFINLCSESFNLLRKVVREPP